MELSQVSTTQVIAKGYVGRLRCPPPWGCSKGEPAPPGDREAGNSVPNAGIRTSEHLAPKPKEALVSLVTVLELAGLALSTTGRVIRILKS